MVKFCQFFANCENSVYMEKFADDISKSGGTILHSSSEWEFKTCTFIVEVDDRDKYYEKFKQTNSYKSEI